MPVLRNLPQRSVVAILGLFDDFFQTDVLANLITASVQQQSREKAAHSPVAVQEWMHAQEVSDENSRENEIVEFARTSKLIVVEADIFNGLWSFSR